MVTEDDVTGIVRTALHDHGTSDVEERWAYACDGTYLSLFQKPKRAHPQDTSLIPVGYPPLNVLRFSSVPNKITTGGKKNFVLALRVLSRCFLLGRDTPRFSRFYTVTRRPAQGRSPTAYTQTHIHTHRHTYTHTHTDRQTHTQTHIHTHTHRQTDTHTDTHTHTHT